MDGKFEIKQNPGGTFMFNLKAANGQIILTSQMYTTKDSAKNGAASVKKNAPLDECYERKESKKAEPFFVLLASNKQVIGNSQMYASKSAMENGIESVKNNGPGAEIVELT